MRNKFAAQLYTLRDQAQHDLLGVLRQCKAMGWAGVEMAGTHGNDPAEIAAVLKETGLSVAGTHVPLDRLTNELEAVLAETTLLGTKNIVCPFIGGSVRDEAGFRMIKATLNDLARRVADRGFRISYHNHDFEFATQIDGTNALQYMLDPTPDNLILAEIDLYWVMKAGVDPLTFIQPYAGRMPLIHLKDMASDEGFAELGTGQIDFPPILAWGQQNGVEWYVVEQDFCPGDPLDSLQISLDNLHRMVG